MAETSVDEAEKCSLNRRKNDTASAKEQSMKALDNQGPGNTGGVLGEPQADK
ncbi:uncharacterized protein FRV6_12458 [Fusarium oxysporum]|uniref:Uncharacterized protein n=2 Tax=Fusarium oxysporum TaxID=5507 RepID=A0A2H3TRG9_FUSOX|nr:hypothetical protein FOXB_12751 [Fusarium oxysporum f. sp. conglutinans Fo5176]SCO88331.1 uncharacterized protein FRV6_12458 [Fusarium oxysporum]